MMAKLKGKPLLAQAWTQAAALYFSEVVPRFKPWTLDAIQPLLTRAPLPQGQVLVLCCGPGHELLLLDEQLKGAHPITGIDLSLGMIELANQLILKHCPGASSSSAAHAHIGHASQVHSHAHQHAGTALLGQSSAVLAGSALTSQQQQQQRQQQQQPRLRAIVGDATVIPQECLPAAAVLSVFGLQQMTAEANTAVSSWVSALSPGGVASIIYWPPSKAQDSPWARFTKVAEEHTKASQASASQPAASSAEQPQEQHSLVTLTQTTPTPSHTSSQEHASRSKSDAACDGAAAFAENSNPATKPVSRSGPTAGFTSRSSSPLPPSPRAPVTTAAENVPWDASLVSSALAVPGVRLCEDRLIRHPFEWPSLSRFWEVMTHGGPWCARRIALGDAHMDQLYVSFAALYAEKDGVADGAPLLLAPEARLLVFTKDAVQPRLERETSRL